MNISATQNKLILTKLMQFYDHHNLKKMLSIIAGDSKISLRIIDWFTTNYAKKYYVVIKNKDSRFKVYDDYKLMLKAYSKQRFDPFCRWDRIVVPYATDTGNGIETTIGQLNFFKWALENNIIDYIEKNYIKIETDMNTRNSTSRRKNEVKDISATRKKREELSISATKSIKKEMVEISLSFNG